MGSVGSWHCAGLAIFGTVVAILAYAIDGPNSFVGLFFGRAGSPGVFYFAGAYLRYTTSCDVGGEELLCGVAWYFGSLVGWSVVPTQTNVLSTTPGTVFELPAPTALGITHVIVATGYQTGRRESETEAEPHEETEREGEQVMSRAEGAGILREVADDVEDGTIDIVRENGSQWQFRSSSNWKSSTRLPTMRPSSKSKSSARWKTANRYHRTKNTPYRMLLGERIELPRIRSAASEMGVQ